MPAPTGEACAATCSDLWLSEHRPIPGQPSSASLWKELDGVVEGEELLPPVPGPLSLVADAVGAFSIGWAIGTGINEKFLHFGGAGLSAPPGSICDGFHIGYHWTGGGVESVGSSSWVGGERATNPNGHYEYAVINPDGVNFAGIASDGPEGGYNGWCSYQGPWGPSPGPRNWIGTWTTWRCVESHAWGTAADLMDAPPEDYTDQSAAGTTPAPPDPGPAAVEDSLTAALADPANATLTQWLAYELDPRCNPDPLDESDQVSVPEPLDNESVSDYEQCLGTLGLTASVATLSETVLDAGDGDVVETDPESGTVVEPGSEVKLAANPQTAIKSTEDPRCRRPENGAPDPDAPAAPPNDTKFPQYAEVNVFPDGIDPTTDPWTMGFEIPLRWGTTRWGRRHILIRRGFNDFDANETAVAISADKTPAPAKYENQWIFHGPAYEMPDGTGGTIQCARGVVVDFNYRADFDDQRQYIITTYYGRVV